MESMNKNIVWIALAFAAGVGALMYTSLQGVTNHRVEVCMSFNGRDNCRTARGNTEAEAKRTATDNACADLTSGMAQITNCQNATPTSVKVLDAN
jgi:hypothetical protein